MERRAIIGLGVVVALVAVTVMVTPIATAGMSKGLSRGCPAGLIRVAGTTDLCTHGADSDSYVCLVAAWCLLGHRQEAPKPNPTPTTNPTPAPNPTPTNNPTPAPNPTPTTNPTPEPGTPPCIGDGRSGKRIQLFYAYTTENRPEDYQAVRAAAEEADRWLAQQSAPRGQTFRWLCEGGSISVTPIKIPGTELADFVNAARGAGYNSPDRIYTAMTPNGSGGTGSIEGDDRPGSDNRNNTGPAYSITRSLTRWTTLAHELGHNLGAVQPSAPHSSGGGWHCYDEPDLMCYDDGESYFRNGGQLTYPCGSAPQAMDCRRDDYYSPDPSSLAPDSYLARHWNVYNSTFLTHPT